MNTMEQWADLHVHTTASDGSFTPAEAVRYARDIGLSAIAIADHDSIDGIAPAIEAGKSLGVEIIPAIELSAEPAETFLPELHFLGYWIDWHHEELLKHIAFFRDARKKRAKKIFEKLARLDIVLETDELLKIGEEGSIGRLHVAKALLNQKFVRNIHEAFDRYLGYGKPAYVPKPKVSSNDAIALITQASGVPVLAHPLYGAEDNTNLIKNLSLQGLKGIEVYHPKHSKSIIRLFEQQAEELGLARTGGSDCHGSVNGSDPSMGSVRIPFTLLETLRKLKKI